MSIWQLVKIRSYTYKMSYHEFLRFFNSFSKRHKDTNSQLNLSYKATFFIYFIDKNNHVSMRISRPQIVSI